MVSGTYKLNESKEVFLLYKAIYFSQKGLYYKKLVELSGKNKNTISNQLKPLKENNLIKKTYDKIEKDYLFEIDFKELTSLIWDEHIGKKKTYENLIQAYNKEPTCKTSSEKKEYVDAWWIKQIDNTIKLRFTDKNMYVAENFNQYFLLISNKIVPIHKDSDLKKLFQP